MTHDYKRNGTTTLFAAFERRSTAERSSAGTCFPRHRAIEEFIRKFLNVIEREHSGRSR